MTTPTTYTYTIPSCLKKGFYLVRHEIIALHAAWTYPGAQFYPGCHQLNVTGGGSATAPAAKLVAFPGAYKPTDPGVTYDAYKGKCKRVMLPTTKLLLTAVSSANLHDPRARRVYLLVVLPDRMPLSTCQAAIQQMLRYFGRGFGPVAHWPFHPFILCTYFCHLYIFAIQDSLPALRC